MLQPCSAELPSTTAAVLAHAFGRCSRQSSTLAARQKRRPQRGGQDLTNRYQRLERSIREKYAISQNIADLSSQTFQTPNIRVQSATNSSRSSSSSRNSSQMFHGLLVPQEPKPPASDECCMSGCAVCVYDLYDESLQTYKDSVSALQRSLTTLGIPDTEWPPSVRPQNNNQDLPTPTSNAKQVSLDAFEAMELALKAKLSENDQGENRS